MDTGGPLAKHPWVAGTPTLPFESVFPSNNDIKNENLHRKNRQSRWLQSSLSTKMDGWIDKDADATRRTKVNPRNWQNRRKTQSMDRRSKRAAQKDSVSRLSRARKTVQERIFCHVYYSRSKPSRTSSKLSFASCSDYATSSNSPSLPSAITPRNHQNSLATVCAVFIGGGKFDGEMSRGFPSAHDSAIYLYIITNICDNNYKHAYASRSSTRLVRSYAFHERHLY